jgi:hypothetical protein
MTDLTLAILAVWRVTHLLNAEDGPFDLIVELRRRAGDGFWGPLLDCFYCLSLWVALPVALLSGRPWRERLLLWPGLSAGAIAFRSQGRSWRWMAGTRRRWRPCRGCSG